MAEFDEDEPAVVIERRSGGGVGVFLLGLAVGAGLALLFAPQAGAETRADLRHGARRLRRKARDLANGAEEAVQGIARGARDAARETRDALERRLSRHQRHAGADADDAEDAGV